MKFVIQKETGLGETSVVEIEARMKWLWMKWLWYGSVEASIRSAYKLLDERLWQTNAKIADVRDFVNQIKDPNYRYLFVSFFDTLLGISSQAEPLQRKFKVEPPVDFQTWLAAKGDKK